MLILGACCRTTVYVESFSPLETGLELQYTILTIRNKIHTVYLLMMQSMLQVSFEITLPKPSSEVHRFLVFCTQIMVLNSGMPFNLHCLWLAHLISLLCYRALLVISCFRKKFAGTLSSKEIVGSKHVICLVNYSILVKWFRKCISPFQHRVSLTWFQQLQSVPRRKDWLKSMLVHICHYQLSGFG